MRRGKVQQKSDTRTKKHSLPARIMHSFGCEHKVMWTGSRRVASKFQTKYATNGLPGTFANELDAQMAIKQMVMHLAAKMYVQWSFDWNMTLDTSDCWLCKLWTTKGMSIGHQSVSIIASSFLPFLFFVDLFASDEPLSLSAVPCNATCNDRPTATDKRISSNECIRNNNCRFHACTTCLSATHSISHLSTQTCLHSAATGRHKLVLWFSYFCFSHLLGLEYGNNHRPNRFEQIEQANKTAEETKPRKGR